jgi:hypothetical protein
MVGIFVYASIVFGLVYFVHLKLMGGDNQEMELRKKNWLKPK